MNSIGILVPVLARPQNARLLVDSIRSTTTVAHSIHFLCSPLDHREIEACHKAEPDQVWIMNFPAGPGDWAKKINEGYLFTLEPFMLLGADDLRFHPNWDTEALRVAEETGAGVIGTNDLGNATVMRGLHSTHPLVRRSYIEEYGTIDEPGKVVHEQYHHQWCDTELCETAMARQQWAFAKDSHVEHLHPCWHKSEMDSTYQKALSTPREDYAIFRKRRPLWKSSSLRPRKVVELPL